MTTKRRNCRVLVLEALRKQNMQTIADIAALTNLSKEGVRLALQTLIEQGYVHKTALVRKFVNYESHIFAFGPGDVDSTPDEPMMHVRERTKAMEDTAKTIQGLRAVFTPEFDPFRVLRAQVGGMA